MTKESPVSFHFTSTTKESQSRGLWYLSYGCVIQNTVWRWIDDPADTEWHNSLLLQYRKDSFERASHQSIRPSVRFCIWKLLEVLTDINFMVQKLTIKRRWLFAFGRTLFLYPFEGQWIDSLWRDVALDSATGLFLYNSKKSFRCNWNLKPNHYWNLMNWYCKKSFCTNCIIMWNCG